MKRSYNLHFGINQVFMSCKYGFEVLLNMQFRHEIRSITDIIA